VDGRRADVAPGPADAVLPLLDEPGGAHGGRMSTATTAPSAPAVAATLPSRRSRLRRALSNPWGKPRLLFVFAMLYLAWSILPVAIAVLFSFNAGKSRSSFQGFSLRWYVGDPIDSVLHDATLRGALSQSLKLA